MRRSTLGMCALLVTATFGCEEVKKQAATVGATVKDKIELVRERFFHKKPPVARSAPPATGAPAAPPPAPPPASPASKPGTAPPLQRAPAQPAHPQPAQPVPSEPVPEIPVTGPARRRDVPYVSQDTGTIFPGMAERDVYSLWGAPAAVRHRGEFTYLFFQNGCEYSCGTMDVVTLQGGQVIDAIVRWPGHGYGGQSTSPTGGTPEAPPGGDKLIITPDTMRTPDTTQTQSPTPE